MNMKKKKSVNSSEGESKRLKFAKLTSSWYSQVRKKMSTQLLEIIQEVVSNEYSHTYIQVLDSKDFAITSKRTPISSVETERCHFSIQATRKFIFLSPVTLFLFSAFSSVLLSTFMSDNNLCCCVLSASINCVDFLFHQCKFKCSFSFVSPNALLSENCFLIFAFPLVQ